MGMADQSMHSQSLMDGTSHTYHEKFVSNDELYFPHIGWIERTKKDRDAQVRTRSSPHQSFLFLRKKLYFLSELN
jgi:hypothetical protein